MAAKQPLTNFTKGEFSPDLYARVDIPQYAAGAKTIRNFIIQRQGGLKFRPGFRFAGEADSVAAPERMIPFFYRQNAAFMMALSDLRQRALTQGGFVTEDDLEIQSFTLAAQMVIAVPYHAYNVGDRVFFDGNTGPAELNGSYATVVAVVDADHVRLDVDSTGFAPLTASTGITRVGAPDPPPAPPPPLDPPPEPDEPPTGTGGEEPGDGPGGGIPWWKFDNPYNLSED